MEKVEIKKQHHRIVPIACITFGVPIAMVVVFLIVVNLLFHDEKPPNDSMLRLPDISVSDEHNAYVDVQRMDAKVLTVDPSATQPLTDTKVDDLLNGGAWDETYASEVTKKYAAAMEDFHLAANKEQYQGPIGAHPNAIDSNTFPTAVYQVRFVAKLIALEGLRQAKNGDVTNGLAQVMDSIRLGQRMEQSQGTIIEWLVGGATKQIGLSALRQIARQTTLTSDQTASVSRELEAYRGTADGLVTALKMEYAYSRSYMSKQLDLGQVYDGYFLVVNAAGNTIPRSTTGKVISALDTIGVFRFYYWPNQSWRFLLDRRIKDIQYAQVSCATGNFTQTAPVPYSHRVGFGRLFEANTIGKLLADIGNVSLGGAAMKACNETLAVSATQTMLASSAYQHDYGKLPQTLNELVPKYLNSVPLDPYSGKPLLYDAAQKIIYSVGQDRKDEHGNLQRMTDYATPNGEWQNMFDPTFTLQ